MHDLFIKKNAIALLAIKMQWKCNWWMTQWFSTITRWMTPVSWKLHRPNDLACSITTLKICKLTLSFKCWRIFEVAIKLLIIFIGIFEVFLKNSILVKLLANLKNDIPPLLWIFEILWKKSFLVFITRINKNHTG